MAEIAFVIDGLPPGKNEALSMLGANHPHASRVRALLAAARAALPSSFTPLQTQLGLEVEVRAPADASLWHATNYLGGIGDVLEVKSRRGELAHLGELARVALYVNDRQIREVRYRVLSAPSASYSVRVWTLPTRDSLSGSHYFLRPEARRDVSFACAPRGRLCFRLRSLQIAR